MNGAGWIICRDRRRDGCGARAALAAALLGALLIPGPARGQDFDADLNRAWLSYNAGHHAEAVAQIREFIARYASDPIFPTVAKRLQYLVALSSVRLKDWPAAIEATDRYFAVQGDPQPAWDEELTFWKGVACAKTGRSGEARDLLKKFAETHAASDKAFPAMMLVGNSFLEESRFQEAADYLASIRPKLVGARLGRVLVIELYARMEAGDLDRALRLAGEAEELGEAVPQIARLQTLLLDLARRLGAASRYREAIAAALRLMPRQAVLDAQAARLATVEKEVARLKQTDPDGPATLQQMQLVALLKTETAAFEKIPDYDSIARFSLASAFLGLERPRETAHILDGMLGRLPASPVVEQASDTLVRCLAETGRWPKLVEVADRFAAKFPTSKALPGVLLLKGQALQEQRLYPEAMAAFDAVAGRFPGSPFAADAAFLKGFTLLLTEDYPGAVAAFDAVLRDFPSGQAAERSAYWRGEALSMHRDHPAAITAMERYLADYPSGAFSVAATYRIAFSRQTLSEFDKSLPALEKFIADHPLDPNAPEARILLGDALLAQGRLDEGIAALRAVPKEAAAHSEEAWFKIGKALRLSERIPEAREHFRQFQEEHPGSARLAEAVYWEGWTLREDPEKCREVYWRAVDRFGDDPAQWGVSEILDGLAKLSKAPEDRAAFLRRLEALDLAATRDERRALRLRTAAALARIESPSDPQKSRKRLLDNAWLADPKTDDPDLTVEFADALRADGKRREAEALYLDIRRWNPLAPCRDRIFRGLGLLALEAGDDAAAVRWFDRALREVPTTPLRGDLVLASADPLRRLNRAPQALASLEALLEEKSAPKRAKAEALYKIGELHLAAGDAKRAIPYFQRVYVLYAGFRETAARAYLQSGLAFAGLGDAAAAAKTFAELLGLPEFASDPALRPALDRAREELAKLPAAAREAALAPKPPAPETASP